MEFLLFDVDPFLMASGFLWLEHFFSKWMDLEKKYKPLIGKLWYRKVKWATASKRFNIGKEEINQFVQFDAKQEQHESMKWAENYLPKNLKMVDYWIF